MKCSCWVTTKEHSGGRSLLKNIKNWALGENWKCVSYEVFFSKWLQDLPKENYALFKFKGRGFWLFNDPPKCPQSVAFFIAFDPLLDHNHHFLNERKTQLKTRSIASVKIIYNFPLCCTRKMRSRSGHLVGIRLKLVVNWSTLRVYYMIHKELFC